MKKVLTEKVIEEYKCYCDKHLDRECFSEVKAFSWYGSEFDMMGIEIHLCDECLKEFYEECYKKYKIEPKEIDLV